MVAEAELSAVIADIYDAAIDPALWQQALARICIYLGGSSAVLFWHDAATLQSQALHIFNDNPEFTRLYFEKYLPMNPVFPAATFVEAGKVHGGTDIIPQAELEQTRFYKEWLEPQGIVDVVAVNLEKGIVRSAFFNVRTDASYGMVDEKMRERTALLVPHLQRAVAIGKLFDQGRSAEQRVAEMAKTLDHVEAAVFMVDAGSQIVFANEPARKVADEAVLVRTRDSTLEVIDTDAARTLQDVITAAAKGDASLGMRGVAINLTGVAGERWFAHVLPLTAGRRQQAGEANAAVAAVFVRMDAPNAPPPLESIAKLYSLTAGEARVLDAVLKVRGVKAMAEMLGLSQATVKTHLQNVFRKTGVKRQADLIKLVEGDVPQVFARSS